MPASSVQIHFSYWLNLIMNDYKSLAAKLAGKKILISGATGFVGKNICDFLVGLNRFYNSEIKITGLARKLVLMEGVTFHSHDVLNPLELDAHFDFIIHAATPVTTAEDSDQKTLDIIVRGTENILAFSRKCKASRFLLVSSGAVYGVIPESVERVPEEFIALSPLNNAYAQGKMLSESICLDFLNNNQITLNIARCFAFSGKHLPLDAHFAIGNFVKDALGQKPIKVKGDGSAVRSYMDSEDMVYWLLSILLHDKNDVFNVGSDQAISIKELAYKVAATVPGLEVIIEGKSQKESKKNIYVPSISKGRSLLGLELNTTLESSIQKMMQMKRA